MALVEITPQEYDVEIDIVYATDRNFTGAPIYLRPACYLHQDAAACLKKASLMARRQGVKLRLLDAFRPQEAQRALWNHTPNADFVANPDIGSPHGRGVAIDLTLLDQNGKELDMGTGFDEMDPKSYHGAEGISKTAESNRLLLLGIMVSAGFEFYHVEWWHYQLPNARTRYPLFSDSSLKYPMMRAAG
ncbi:D-alanyl-D-alanine dipeptidase [Thalassospira profundimaris]|uniref:D-alanyl-D-alanine dipeptidase n=1 Tax=Thalassospira profundimaris TaxID=502049 RepID=A0A367XL70_9PROT|nr:D-alanyl-D-alanine dipeptidase [Thalassospira profundimaris]RCK53900.1 D-alanyl-D-alanine dipeptidase [Thalassospira profundimaris]